MSFSLCRNPLDSFTTSRVYLLSRLYKNANLASLRAKKILKATSLIGLNVIFLMGRYNGTSAILSLYTASIHCSLGRRL
jgi:hypothetical protein